VVVVTDDAGTTLARWDHAAWLQQRLGEARAANAALQEQLDAARDVVAMYHRWLERVEAHPGYIGLDHAAGENVEGCSGCSALAGVRDA
jgi:hypothetical protein